jgi:hypothetical protein
LVTKLSYGVRADGCTRRLLLARGALASAAVGAAGILATAGAADAGGLKQVARRGSRRLVIWRGLDAWRSEVASIDLRADGITASGTQIGFAPMAYRLDYLLDASSGFVTRRLEVTAEGRGWSRTLDLRREATGAWTARAHAHGDVDLPDPGGDVGTFADALDCDLGFSPLTNLMPIRRSRLHEREGAADFLMAWVSVPDLSVVASAQRYEHVRATDDGSIVRYVDRGLFPGFTADLRLDPSGVVERYPELAAQVRPKRRK